MTTDTDRVIETLRRSPGLHDDELARQVGIEPSPIDLQEREHVELMAPSGL